MNKIIVIDNFHDASGVCDPDTYCGFQVSEAVYVARN